MSYDFDAPYDPRGTGSAKWDAISAILGEDRADGLPMWVAQMDFAPAPFLTRAARDTAERGQWGYFVQTPELYAATAWWQEARHGWAADPGDMMATHGLGNAIGLCLQSLTEPGDGVVIFTPVYHEFTNKIRRNGRRVVESPLALGADGTFAMDLDALEARLDGSERLVLISQPHNPAGRIWTEGELRALAALCDRHDLILVSDEIHQDLTLPGHDHVPTATAAPDARDRLVVMTAASKTFDIAGLRTGVMTVPGEPLRERIGGLYRALDIQPNLMGVELTRAAYTPEGAAWLDALRDYIDGNRKVIEAGVATLPGVSAMPMQGTYLAWLDFGGTGMDQGEIASRLGAEGLALSPGPDFGTGGTGHARLNIGTQRARVEEAVERLHRAFADLQ